jgi:hypothetical protein
MERREKIFSRPIFAEANRVCHCPQLQQILLPSSIIISPSFVNTKNDTHLSTSLQTTLIASKYVDKNIKRDVSDITTNLHKVATGPFGPTMRRYHNHLHFPAASIEKTYLHLTMPELP